MPLKTTPFNLSGCVSTQYFSLASTLTKPLPPTWQRFGCINKNFYLGGRMKIIKLLIIALIFFKPEIVHAATPQISDEQAHEIVLNGTPDDVKKLIQSGYDVNREYLASTLLITAVKSAFYATQTHSTPQQALEKIKILVNSGAEVDFTPNSGFAMTALDWAIVAPVKAMEAENLVNIIYKEKIEKGKGQCKIPNVIDKPCKDITAEDRKVIKNAIHSVYVTIIKKWIPDYMEIIKYLVANGSNINNNNNAKKITPIHLATMNPSEITIEPLIFLIQQGADINAQDIDGNTPLFWAYGSRDEQIVSLLKEAGADENIKNHQGLLYNQVTAIKTKVNIEEDNQLTVQFN